MSRLVSSAELARLPGAPAKTTQGINKWARRNDWFPVGRAGKGGAAQFDLDHPAAQKLPVVTRLALGRLEAEVAGAPADRAPDAPSEKPVPEPGGQVSLTAPNRAHLNARREVLSAFAQYQRLGGVPQAFCDSFNRREIDLSESTYALIGRTPLTLSRLSRWGNEPKAPRFGGRRGKTKLTDEMQNFIEAAIQHNPTARATHVHEGMRGRFAGAKLPSVGTVRGFMRRWIRDNRALHDAISNPSRYRSHRRFAVAQADAEITRPNQEWQIDGSPSDVLLKDGSRYVTLAVIDVYTRRSKFLVARSESTDSVLLLLRRAILAWGAPESARTDNGSAFTSSRFRAALADLGIGHVVCPPYAGEAKGYVERVQGYMHQHLLERLPGYVGHSVAERQAIRNRAAFGRRAASDRRLYEVALSAEELQGQLDRWADEFYGNRAHPNLAGLSPNQVAASWPGEIRRVDERALDVLLSPAPSNPTRIVGKRGVRIEGADFAHEALAEYSGEPVRVFLDAADLGQIVCFTAGEPTRFICVAQNIERLGIGERQALALRMHQRQAAFIAAGRRRLARIARQIRPHQTLEKVLDAARGNAPKGDALATAVEHETDAILAAKAAADAMRPASGDGRLVLRPDHPSASVAAVRPAAKASPEARWRSFLRLKDVPPEELSEDEIFWLKMYRESGEYKARIKLGLLGAA